MARYHINPETQRPNICRATKEPCRYAVDGEEPQHYGSKEEAQAAVAAQVAAENSTFSTVSKGNAKRKLQASKPAKGKVRNPTAPRTFKDKADREAFKNEPSQLCCPECGTPATQIQMGALAYEDSIICKGENCEKKRFDIYSAKVTPRDHAAPIIFDPKKIGERTWIHMTNSGENWHDKVSEVDDLVIHAGDYEAAADRMLSENMHKREDHTVRMFTISFKDPDSLRVMKPIGEDMNSEILKDMESYDAAAYINRWEAPGTISIEANPRVMQVEKVETVSLGELRKLASFYNIPDAEIREAQKQDKGLSDDY